MLEGRGLVKLMEECGELVQIAAKKLAFIDSDEHPDKAGSMKIRLEDEIADVEAICKFIKQEFKLDEKRIYERRGVKFGLFDYWHEHSD